MRKEMAVMLDELKSAKLAKPFDEKRYLAACQTIIDNRDKLTHRVYIDLPGGLTANRDPLWDAVRAGSKQRCGCGNERTILPAVQRTEFVASEAAPVVIAGEDSSNFKPAGGDKASAYLRLSVEMDDNKQPYMVFRFEPFSNIMTLDMFDKKGYPLQKLAEALVEESPLELRMGEERVPICAITAVDEAAGTVTVILDKDIEVLTKEEIEAKSGHQH